MKISILLPYKENFSSEYAGAVSIFIRETTLKSKFRNTTTVYGNTDYKKDFLKDYVNIELGKKNIFKSYSNLYVNNFVKNKIVNKSDLIEIHNRPSYLSKILKIKKSKKVLYFHNNPLEMNGSRSVKERLHLIENLDKIIFNSEWTKKQFLKDLPKLFFKIDKLIVIYQSTNKPIINLKKKEKIITFVGKLNKAKGYDLFGEAAIKILKNFKDWRVEVVGDELREQIMFNHERFNVNGFQKHKKVLSIFKKSSIAVICSRWNEPFGRTSLEASSNGCASIVSDKGGLLETNNGALILRNLTVKNLYKLIKKLIIDVKLMNTLQKSSIDNFYLTHSFVANQIDSYRKSLLSVSGVNNRKKLKIIHITNFNERHDGRLFFNTGRRINNGFIRLNHSVLTVSDRDIISNNRSIRDPSGSNKLNEKLLNIISNYIPDLIVLGHADTIDINTLKFIKKFYPKVRFGQWFLDKMNEEWRGNKNRFLDKIGIMNASFCTTSTDVLKLPSKSKIFYIPNPADESFETLRCYENKHPINDLFFAISHGVHRGILKDGKFDKRSLIVNNLVKSNPNIKFDLHGINHNQPIWADDYKLKLYQNKMALNLSQGKSIKYYSSDRIAQLIGNGILTFVDIRTKLNKFFTSNEVIFYNSITDLSKKINFYYNNPKLRNQIAKNGKKKYLKYFNSTEVAGFIIDKTMNFKSKKKYWE